MFQKLYDLLRGYLQLKITGNQFNKLVNLLMLQGVELWNIVRIEDTFYANINFKDFNRIRSSVRKTDCKVTIYQRKGFPFWIDKLMGRKVLAIGIVFVIVSIYIMSHFVLFIEIKGTKELKEEEIISLLNQVEIYPGVLKSSIPLHDLTDFIIENKPRVSWANVYFQGTKLIVQIVEKELLDTEINPSDIIAEKSGVIKELIVLRGSPQVEEGMVVQRGDVLISREVKVKKKAEATTNKEEIDEFKIKKVKAEGMIKANVWYKGYGEAKLVEYYQQPTGNYKTSLIIKLNDQEYVLKGPSKPPYANFLVKEEVKSLPQWRNYEFPLEVVIRKYIQIKEFKEVRSFKQAKELAKERAIDSILQRIEKEAIILNSKLKLIETNNNEQLVRIKALVEVEEEIGTRRE
ncbi:sporulation protein YqfD [Halobacteroides halobius DSM 5150]|uniref:Sporulation protein YqfD n=1 Tax=Halobacteroides halobius (strain ATCC 35273 / DSM 5150 / MD-1) TaxID=748449 RepID=L0KBA1_HALHC|nr:sporulation protein YqfD [Halobacteroides halobius]AGB41800.1 sporulation protein YqfD [Halobacteroides halobius DSM 5150]